MVVGEGAIPSRPNSIDQPYHSKYNPVERVWGALGNHWNGSVLDTVETALNFAQTMILTVSAMNGQGQGLSQQAGPIVPDRGGPQAELSGKGFAKVLRDAQTGESPVVSYWKQALIVSDNRIPAMGSDTSVYVYAAPAVGSSVTITAELRFRRAFQAVIDARGWNTSDIVMEEIHTTLHVQPGWRIFLPVVVRDVPTPDEEETRFSPKNLVSDSPI